MLCWCDKGLRVLRRRRRTGGVRHKKHTQNETRSKAAHLGRRRVEQQQLALELAAARELRVELGVDGALVRDRLVQQAVDVGKAGELGELRRVDDGAHRCWCAPAAAALTGR